MEKSSNYFNSLMVFMGFYKGDVLSEELNKVAKGERSTLFKKYQSHAKGNNFPAFTLKGKEGDALFNFSQWVTDDGMPIHQNGSLQVGFSENFGLWNNYEYNLFDSQIRESADVFRTDWVDPLKSRSSSRFAFPEVSYLPEQERITYEGASASIINTTLGAYPFEVTPFKMAEMFGRLFSQNRNFRLTVNQEAQPVTAAPFSVDEEYLSNQGKGVYANVLSNYLFEGLSRVPLSGTAANSYRNGRIIYRLTGLAKELKQKGYNMYAKTGTISDSRRGTAQSQLLAVVITQKPVHGLKDAQSFEDAIKDNRFYVLYFLTEKHNHNYGIIQNAIKTVAESDEFKQYMNTEE
jgi:hypothetical protein